MDAQTCLKAIRDNMQKVMVGKDNTIDLLLVALICSGHVLIEDLPGLGKTTLVSALADSLGCAFQRIQFTPDVLPSDITGYNTLNLQTGEQVFHPGSIHHQIVLGDEINRASPKTQSSLLEAMQEHQVTVDGVTYKLPRPFMVLATQNPVDMAGTYPLPEAQMDRFLMQISMGYPTPEEEVAIVNRRRSVTSGTQLQPVATAEDILAMQEQLPEVHVEPELVEYIVGIVNETRRWDGVLTGCSPRGSIALMQASCALAMLRGRMFVLPDDIKEMAVHVLPHRMIMKNRSGAAGTTALDAVREILATLRVPKVKG
ncbi:MAG: MoxR family ATPase [Clostridia bacterium]|nr:MoxR family ATPase [Clostridia bacterium]